MSSCKRTDRQMDVQLLCNFQASTICLVLIRCFLQVLLASKNFATLVFLLLQYFHHFFKYRKHCGKRIIFKVSSF